MESKHFSETAVVCKPDQRCDVLPLTPDLYDRLDREYQGFRQHALVAMYSFSKDWTSWEIHPKGDELVCLLSGEMDLVLRTDAGDEVLRLDSPGAYVVVPANTWHTARVESAAAALFITPGEGTRHGAPGD